MIDYACPACEAHLNSPDSDAGTKLPCPACGQRLRVPFLPNRTVLARPLPPGGAGPAPTASATPAVTPTAPIAVAQEPLEVLPAGDDGRPDRPQHTWRCPGCGYRGSPDVRPRMADLSMTIILVGVLFWPLIIAGVLLKDDYEVCPDCGALGSKVSGPHF